MNHRACLVPKRLKDLKSHPIPSGVSWQEVVASLGATKISQWGTTITTAINTGRLYHSNLMLLVDGKWFRARLWDAEIGERWVLIEWGNPISARNSAEAILKFREEACEIDVNVSKQLVRKHKGDNAFLQFLIDAEEERAKLKRLRLETN